MTTSPLRTDREAHAFELYAHRTGGEWQITSVVGMTDIDRPASVDAYEKGHWKIDVEAAIISGESP